jgi:hypothetical protein
MAAKESDANSYKSARLYTSVSLFYIFLRIPMLKG